MNDEIIEWLLAGDIAIQYQVHRDLLGYEQLTLQQRIATEGWAADYLTRRISVSKSRAVIVKRFLLKQSQSSVLFGRDCFAGKRS